MTYRLIFSLLLPLVALQANAETSDSALSDEQAQALVAPYIQLQEVLAADDLAEAKLAAGKLQTAIPEGHLEEVKSALESISNAKEIAAAREPFKIVSDEMIAVVREHKIAYESGLYLAHCPMAFSNKGGYWMQDDKKVNNPYYGAMMLRCGSIRETLVEDSNSEDANNHSHHNH